MGRRCCEVLLWGQDDVNESRFARPVAADILRRLADSGRRPLSAEVNAVPGSPIDQFPATGQGSPRWGAMGPMRRISRNVVSLEGVRGCDGLPVPFWQSLIGSLRAKSEDEVVCAGRLSRWLPEDSCLQAKSGFAFAQPVERAVPGARRKGLGPSCWTRGLRDFALAVSRFVHLPG